MIRMRAMQDGNGIVVSRSKGGSQQQSGKCLDDDLCTCSQQAGGGIDEKVYSCKEVMSSCMRAATICMDAATIMCVTYRLVPRRLRRSVCKLTALRC